MTPSPRDIRDFITDSFSEEEFVELFCTDYFPRVKGEFSAGMSFAIKAQRLINYCQYHGVMENLLTALQNERPEPFAARFAQTTPQPVKTPEPPPASPRNPRQIFVSHAHQDAEFAGKLANDLRQRGWTPWITPESILPGEKWVTAIGRGLDGSLGQTRLIIRTERLWRSSSVGLCG